MSPTSIYRAKRKSNFTILNNNVLRDSRLSLKAKGLLALMLSFPDDWHFREGHLGSLSADGRDAHRSGLKELQAAGYIERVQLRDKAGKLAGTKLIVHDEPFTADGFSGDGFSGAGETPPTNTYYNQDLENEENPMSAFADEAGDQEPVNEGKAQEGSASPTASPSLTSERAREKKASRQTKAQRVALEKSRMESLLAVWNEHRGNLPQSRVLGADLQHKLLNFIEWCDIGGLDAAQAMAVVTKAVVASGDYHKDRHRRPTSYGLGNLLAKGNWEKYYDAGMDMENVASVQDFKVGDRVRWLRNRSNQHLGYATGVVTGFTDRGTIAVDPDPGQSGIAYGFFTIYPEHLSHEQE